MSQCIQSVNLRLGSMGRLRPLGQGLQRTEILLCDSEPVIVSVARVHLPEVIISYGTPSWPTGRNLGDQLQRERSQTSANRVEEESLTRPFIINARQRRRLNSVCKQGVRGSSPLSSTQVGEHFQQ
jgi:hypothetical protein